MSDFIVNILKYVISAPTITAVATVTTIIFLFLK